MRIDVGAWLVDFQIELDALLSDMNTLCMAVNEERYAQGSPATTTGCAIQFQIPHAEHLRESAPQRTARTTFISAMSKLSMLLDRLIATRRVILSGGLFVDRDLNSENDVIAYMVEKIDAAVAQVARDGSLNVPKKLEHFSGVDLLIKDMVSDYNKLRNALEHHHDFPRTDIRVTIRRIIPLIDDKEVAELPVLVKAGSSVSIRQSNIEKVFPANQVVILEPADVQELLFTLKYLVAPAIVQWHTANPRG